MIAMRESLRRDLSLSANSIAQVHSNRDGIFSDCNPALSDAATASLKFVFFSPATKTAQRKSQLLCDVFSLLCR
jgi:hypothetical protein